MTATAVRRARRAPSSVPQADVRAAAKAAYETARAARPGPVSMPQTGEHRAPPRVFKKKQRSYGHRLLRINQDDRVDPAESTR